MSFEGEYPLLEWPKRREIERALAAVDKLAGIGPPDVWFNTDDDEGDDEPPRLTALALDETPPDGATITIQWNVPVARAVDVAIKLGAPGSPEELSKDLDAPHAEVDWDAAESAGAVKRELLPGFKVPMLNRSSISPQDRERFLLRPAHYELFVDILAPDEDEEIQARVLAYSNTGDNRAACVILCQLCEALARELTAQVEN